MRKAIWALGVVAVFGLSLMLIAPADLAAQWGAIQSGADAAAPGQGSGEPTAATATADQGLRGVGVHE